MILTSVRPSKEEKYLHSAVLILSALISSDKNKQSGWTCLFKAIISSLDEPLPGVKQRKKLFLHFESELISFVVTKQISESSSWSSDTVDEGPEVNYRPHTVTITALIKITNWEDDFSADDVWMSSGNQLHNHTRMMLPAVHCRFTVMDNAPFRRNSSGDRSCAYDCCDSSSLSITVYVTMKICTKCPDLRKQQNIQWPWKVTYWKTACADQDKEEEGGRGTTIFGLLSLLDILAEGSRFVSDSWPHERLQRNAKADQQ